MHGSNCVLHIYCSSKCIDPYVDDDGECSLDTDGDSTPDHRVSTVIFYGTIMHYCLLAVNQKLMQVTINYSNNVVSFCKLVCNCMIYIYSIVQCITILM